MPDSITDISDQTWSDLMDADRSVLRELASERDGIDGRGANEALAAGLLAYHGRTGEIPDEYQDEYADEIEAALEGSADPDADVEHTSDDEEVEEESERDNDEASGGLQTQVAERVNLTGRAGTIVEWLEHPDTLVDEAKVHITEGGVTVTAVDPANVGMIDTTLDARAFDAYDVSSAHLIGVNTERVLDTINAAGADDLVNLTLDTDARNLVVAWDGHEFTFSLIDPDSIRKEPDVPDLDLPARAEFEDAGTLKQAISFSDTVSDHIQITADADGTVTVEAEGDTDAYDGTFEDGDEIWMETHPESAVTSLFSLDYMKDMSRAWTSVPLTMHLGNEFPVRLETTVEDDETAVAEVTYLLAPRIQSD